MASLNNSSVKVGFIGAGNMARAICKGFILGGKYYRRISYNIEGIFIARHLTGTMLMLAM